MTTTPTTPDDPELAGARNSFQVQVSNPRVGIELLFPLWQRWRRASATSSTPDPLAGVTFSDAIEAVLAARITGTALVLPPGRVVKVAGTARASAESNVDK